MSDPRIQDIPSIKGVLDDLRSLEQLRRVFPILKPFLRLLGGSVDTAEQAFKRLPEIAKAMHLATVPDRFNDLFASRGWIAYDNMNLAVMEAAIAKGESGDLDGADRDLAAYYDEGTVTWLLGTMAAAKAFQPRMPLARQALRDYIEGRYYACVPVVLALLDGFANDLGIHSFFAKDTDLEAWDSMAAHATGLPALRKLMTQRREKTTTEPIAFPHRNGIMHGRDLGYGNQMVAAKTWAALFAAREWAIRVERGEKDAPPEQPPKTWHGLLNDLKEAVSQKTEADRDLAAMEEWRPRTLVVGADIPVSGTPEEYREDTPERKLVEFLSSWSTGKYGVMARCLAFDSRYPVNGVAGDLRAHYTSKQLKRFGIRDLEDVAPAITTVTMDIVYTEDKDDVQREIIFRMIREDATGAPVRRGKASGTWSVLVPALVW